MLDIHLPKPVYERLPFLYLILAVMLAVAPLGSIKWALSLCLLLAAVVIKRQRRTYREDQRVKLAAELMKRQSTAMSFSQNKGP